MAGFLIQRLIRTAITLFVIVTAVFFATRLSGDAVDFIAGEGLTTEGRAAMIEYFGLNEPVWYQYWRYLYGLLDGNFGLSFIERRPVATIFLERIGPTLELAGLALLVTLFISLPAGVMAATRRGTALDAGIMAASFIGYALPNFVLAILLLLTFSFWLGWLPSTGSSTPWHYVMPVATLAAFYVASLTRFVRGAMLDVLGQDYLRTARAKGVPEHRVILKHALRNALITVLSVLGLQVTGMIAAGNVVVETVFAWRGVGDLLVSAALRRDYPVLQFGVLAVACAVVVINTVVDLLYAAADPRIRLSRS